MGFDSCSRSAQRSKMQHGGEGGKTLATIDDFAALEFLSERIKEAEFLEEAKAPIRRQHDTTRFKLPRAHTNF